MTDYHSHVLPGIDDGAKNIEESLLLLKDLKSQGVDTVYATPHFDALVDNPDIFLVRRNEAYEKIAPLITTDEYPTVYLGAEVMYFSGICNIQNISKLKFANCNLLLLEMPIERWSEYMVSEITKLSLISDVKVVLAHVERYRPLQRRSTWRKLLDYGILMQVNASYFINKKTRRAALKELGKGEIHLLGSDCHSTKNRPPKIAEALGIIKEKFGNNFKINII